MKIPEEVLAIASRLGDLREEVVFVGGMARGPLITDPAVPGPRPTKDVDVILDASGLEEYEAYCARLRKLGFRDDPSEDAPICRYVLCDPTPGTPNPPVDFMPLDPGILGFSNVWYLDAFESSVVVETRAGPIRLINAPCFVATKLESFAARGEGDFYQHDIEDVVVVVDGRPSLITELGTAPRELRTFVAEEVGRLLGEPDFLDALPGHLPPDPASQQRLPLLLSRLRAIAAPLASEQRQRPAVTHDKVRTPAGTRPAPPRPVEHRHAQLAIPSGPAGTAVWRPVRSSNIASFAYDSASRVLTVHFRRGGVYEYEDVPAQIFEGWKAAASAGRYHHRWIRDRYRCRRV